MVLVDTSAWIHFLRPKGDSQVRSRVEGLLKSGLACWCAMVRLELWNGAQGDHEKKVLREMEKHLPDLPVTVEVWEAACALARKARLRGVTVPNTDLLIAACAQHHEVSLEHADEDYEQLATLT